MCVHFVSVGYGMSGDLKSLVSTWPELKEEPLKMEGVLDLLHVHQEVLAVNISPSIANSPICLMPFAFSFHSLTCCDVLEWNWILFSNTLSTFHAQMRWQWYYWLLLFYYDWPLSFSAVGWVTEGVGQWRWVRVRQRRVWVCWCSKCWGNRWTKSSSFPTGNGGHSGPVNSVTQVTHSSY